jgi:hypothetical protein
MLISVILIINNITKGMGIIFMIYIYIIIGFIYAFYFVNIKIKKIDTSAAHTSFFFKLLIFGGSVLLWPVLINKKNISHQ